MRYLSVERPGEAGFTEKRSRFLGFAWPAESVAEAKERVAGLQREYCDARHVCWAWVIGVDSPESYSTDNGEPSGTAGKPILGQINSRGLRNVVVGVVRYFGGIKLGTPGLIAAYRQAASMALDDAGAIECEEMIKMAFTFAYSDMNAVMQLVKTDGVSIVDRTFDNTCSLTVELPKTSAPTLRQRLEAIASVGILTCR